MINANQKIPEGWSIKKLGELGDIVSGGTPDTNNSDYWDGTVLWLTPSEVSALSNRFIITTIRKITNKGLKQSSAKLLPINSLIICTRATIGDCCINKAPMCTNQGFKNIIVKNNDVNFLYYLVTKNKKELIRKACGSTFLEISKKDIENLKFAIPSLPEQEKIAGILSCWDDGIEKLSALIEKKKIQKKALMQQLLTGKHRLKGFKEPWIDVDLASILQYEQPSKYLVDEVLTYNKNKIPVLTANKAFILGSTNDTEGVYNKGDCIIFDDFTTDIKYVDFPFKIKSSAIKILTPLKAETNLKFVFEQMKRIKYPLGGHKRYYLSEFQYLPISLPCPAEQKAIAEILSKADEEIELLNKKLEAFKQEKKALMQQLLTGKIRVKVN